MEGEGYAGVVWNARPLRHIYAILSICFVRWMSREEEDLYIAR
jgi:hypothetical protein